MTVNISPEPSLDPSPSSSASSSSPSLSWEASASYSELISGTYKFLSENVNKTRTGYTFPGDMFADFAKCLENLDWSDLFAVIIMAFVWTFARYILTILLFKPIGSYCQLPRSEQEKLPESAWKCMFYTASWCSVAYMLFCDENTQYFHRPTSIWEGYSMQLQVPTSVYLIYVAQVSFYVHSLYATVFVDQWRRDSIVLMGHHVITSLLLVFSLSTRCHRLGLIAIFLHDVCDILLEGTKTSLYFKQQGDRIVKVFEIIADIGFVCFAITWFLTRLYWFPLRQVYISSVYVNENQIEVPFILFQNSMLYILLSMNIYWFSFILNLLYKVVTGQVDLEDNREYEDQDGRKSPDPVPQDSLLDDQSQVVGKQSNSSSSGYFLRQRKENASEGRSQ